MHKQTISNLEDMGFSYYTAKYSNYLIYVRLDDQARYRGERGHSIKVYYTPWYTTTRNPLNNKVLESEIGASMPANLLKATRMFMASDYANSMTLQEYIDQLQL